MAPFSIEWHHFLNIFMARSAALYILMLDEQSSQAQNVLHTFVCLTRLRRARHKVLHKNAFSDLARRSKAKTAEALFTSSFHYAAASHFIPL